MRHKSLLFIGVLLLLLSASAGCPSSPSPTIPATRTGPATVAQENKTPEEAEPSAVSHLAERPAKRWALVVGVNGYRKLSELNYCGQDALAIKSALCHFGGYDPQSVVLLTDFEKNAGVETGTPSNEEATIDGVPTRAALFARLDAMLKEVRANDTFLFSFSGHGVVGDGHGYLMPLDGDPDHLESTAISVASIYQRLRDCPGATIMVVDACHSGGVRGAKGIQQRPLDHRVFSEEARNIYGIFSCDTQQESFEDPQLGHGVFTYFFVEAMKGRADENSDRKVTLDEVHAYLSKTVPAYVKKSFGGRVQTPYRNVAGTGVAPVIAEYEKFPHAPSDVAVHTLTGLYGGSWSGDFPWLLPSLRSKVAARLPEELVVASASSGGAVPDLKTGMDNADVELVYSRLKRSMEYYVERDEKELPRQDLLHKLLEWDGRADTEDEQQAILQGLKDFDDPHALAVFYARFDMDEEAGRSFQEARQRYARQDPPPLGLLALCNADYASWLASQGDTKQAVSMYQAARRVLPNAGDYPLFSIYCLCSEAQIRRQLGQWGSVHECLSEAERLAAEHLEPHHPVAAYIRERFAWQYMDQWKVIEARSEFEKALAIWSDFREHAFYESPRAQVAEFHNQHGLAMAERYSGRPDVAISLYSELSKNVAAARDAEETDVRARQELTGRLINTLERLADCFLLSAAPQPGPAALVLEQALGETDNLPLGSSRDTARATLLCKLVIARALQGNQARALKARDLLDEIELPDWKEVPTMYRDAARSLAPHADRNEPDPIVGLRTVIAGALQKEEQGKLNRDKLDLMLLLSDQLLRAAGDAGPDLSDVTVPFELVPESFRRPEVLPYLRDYFDRAIQASLAGTQQLPIPSLVRFIITAKAGKPLLLLDRLALIVCYWPETSDGDGSGIAVLQMPDGSGKVVPLAVTLDEVRQREVDAAKWPWPDDLKDIEAPAVQVHWYDLPLDLTNDKFPYQLPKGFDLLPDLRLPRASRTASERPMSMRLDARRPQG